MTTIGFYVFLPLFLAKKLMFS